MINEMLDRLTGYDQPPPLSPELFDLWAQQGFIRPGVRDRWTQTCCDAARSGHLKELHVLRESYLGAMQACTQVLRGLLFSAADPRNYYAGRARLQQAYDEIHPFFLELSTRWVTLDDLYMIAAEELAPTAERSHQLAAHAPPQAWYDEDADPFSPAE